MENNKISIETRIIEPCLEFIEKMERKKGQNLDNGYLEEKRVEISNKIQEGGVIIPRITFIVGTRCTLRCRDCSNLMQYYEKPFDIEIDNLIKDLNQFFSLVDYCVCINVIGGEPFIYPQLEILLDYLIRNEKLGSIEFTTNATAIPSEGVLNLLGNDKVRVEISDYGEIDTLASFIKMMDQYHVKIHVDVDMSWIDCGSYEARNRDVSMLGKMYVSCRASRLCKSLFKGKLFDCPRAVHLVDLGFASNIKFLDIYNCDKHSLLEFWLKEYTMACDYCDLASPQKRTVEPAIQKNGRYLNRSSCTIIPREEYEEIWTANEWYKQQLDNYQKRVLELEEWTAELQKSKDWLEEQYKNYTREVD